jgi:hypothetical protein
MRALLLDFIVVVKLSEFGTFHMKIVRSRDFSMANVCLKSYPSFSALNDNTLAIPADSP